MYSEGLSKLLEANSIDNDFFEEKLYNTLILGVFEAVCKDIKKHGKKIEEKVRFMKYSDDKIAATKNIIKRYVGCTLSENEYKKLSELLIAFFRAGAPRKNFDDSFRENLTQKQNCKCAICGKNITSHDAHLDHIVPWDYVGDNLDNNYQMLCETCNTRKGTSTYFEMSMLLLNKYRND